MRGEYRDKQRREDEARVRGGHYKSVGVEVYSARRSDWWAGVSNSMTDGLVARVRTVEARELIALRRSPQEHSKVGWWGESEPLGAFVAFEPLRVKRGSAILDPPRPRDATGRTEMLETGPYSSEQSHALRMMSIGVRPSPWTGLRVSTSHRAAQARRGAPGGPIRFCAALNSEGKPWTSNSSSSESPLAVLATGAFFLVELVAFVLVNATLLAAAADEVELRFFGADLEEDGAAMAVGV